MITKYNSNRCHVPAFSDDFFNDVVSRKYYGSGFTSTPAVNISEEKNEFRIDVAIAGISKGDVKIDLEDDVLTISSEKKEEKNEKNDQFTRREFNFSAFTRSFQVPDSIEREAIKAEQVDGVLTVHLPKKEESVKPGPKSIEIG